jgi:hypothetical protein
MAGLWRVTYMGDGVKNISAGAFAKYTTAFVEEDVAKSLAGQQDWLIADPSGAEVGSKPAKVEPKPEPKKAEEKKPEKAEEKKPEDKKPEKAEDKKAEKPEKAEKS